jgi:segregation and condensation protein B
MTLDQQIEGVLFYKAVAMKKQALSKLFSVSPEDLDVALKVLEMRLATGAITLITTESEVSLATRPELDEMIEQIRKDEMKRDIGKAGAETLAIILYRGPITRAEIDRIRGVNSSYIVRNLEIRGLVERNNESKQVQFAITTELLRHLGISNKTELKDYAPVMDALEKYESQQTEVSL